MPEDEKRDSVVMSVPDDEEEEDIEMMPWLWDEDLNDPPGPSEGWPHTEPFHLANEMLNLHEMAIMPNDEEYDVDENNNLPTVYSTQIARPEGADTAYYTGVTHFHHANDPNLITLLFSAGRLTAGRTHT